MSSPLPFALGLILAGCPPTSQTFDTGAPVPDFTLEDVNPTSESYERSVSPRDFLGIPSAWYFGHSS